MHEDRERARPQRHLRESGAGGDHRRAETVHQAAARLYGGGRVRVGRQRQQDAARARHDRHLAVAGRPELQGHAAAGVVELAAGQLRVAHRHLAVRGRDVELPGDPFRGDRAVRATRLRSPVEVLQGDRAVGRAHAHRPFQAGDQHAAVDGIDRQLPGARRRQRQLQRAGHLFAAVFAARLGDLQPVAVANDPHRFETVTGQRSVVAVDRARDDAAPARSQANRRRALQIERDAIHLRYLPRRPSLPCACPPHAGAA